MGFFKFLKRDKEQGNDAELDLPPAPPPLEGFEDDKNANFPEFPQISAPKDDDFKFDFPEEDKMPDLGKDEGMPAFPDFDDFDKEPQESEDTHQPVSVPNMNMPPAQKMVPAFNPAPQMPRQDLSASDYQRASSPITPSIAVSELSQSPQSQPSQQAPRHKAHEMAIRSNQSLYVRVDKFKIALDHINVIRSDLRKSEIDLMKLEGLKHEKDSSFEKFKSLLDDLQKKLIFIDKTLFKG